MNKKELISLTPRVLIAFATVLGLMFSSACNHQARVIPPVNIPKVFPDRVKSYKTVKHLPTLRWWTQFHDPELNRLMAKGLACNLDLQIAFDNLHKAQGQLQEIKLSWLPSINTLAGYSTNPALGVPGGFYGVWPYYAINIASLLQQQKRAAYQVDYYQAMIEGARLTVIGQIASAYLTLIAQKEQLNLLKRLDRHLGELVEFNRKEIHIGLKNNIDLAASEVDESLVNSQVEIVEHNIVLSQNALHYLLDENPGSIKNNQSFTRYDFLKFKPGSLPATVLDNRPDIKMAKIAIQSAHVSTTIAQSEFFPVLQLDQFLGEGHLPHAQLAELTDAYFNWSVAPSTFGRISTSKAAYQASVHEYIKMVRKVLKEVDDAFSLNNKLTGYYLKIKKAENDYLYQFKLQQGLLKTGLISYKQLLENEVKLDNLALASNQAKLELGLSLVLLYQDLAGGYRDKRP